MELIFDSVRAEGTKSLLNINKFVIRRSEFGHVFPGAIVFDIARSLS